MTYASSHQLARAQKNSGSGNKSLRVKQSDTVRSIIRPKLKTGTLNDPFEQEADRVAEQVMQGTENSRIPAVNSLSQGQPIQRKCSACHQQEELLQTKSHPDKSPQISPQTEAQIKSLTNGGHPLAATHRHFFEHRFASDFSSVRIHHDNRAAQVTKSINARAFTLGKHVFFGHGEFRPEASQGKKLIAHELTHVIQQGKSQNHLSRKPIENISSTESLHESIGQQYSQDSGTSYQPGIQYSSAYGNWLQAKSAQTSFEPPIEVPVNPLERLKQKKPTGKTFLLINGKEAEGKDMSETLDKMSKLIKPTAITSSTDSSGQKSCQFDPAFKLKAGTRIIVTTAPGSRGWKGKLPASALNNPPECSGKTDIPATLRGENNDDKGFQKLVRDSELEHVDALDTLYQRHLVPFYNFAMSLSASASSNTACNTQLNNKLGKRVDQAVFGFTLGDAAETRRFDDPASTHHGKFIPSIGSNCNKVTLTTKQTNPEQPGTDPGNVKKITAKAQAIDSSKLSLNGTDLLSDNKLIHTFASARDAVSALVAMQVHNITELQSIGNFRIALSNGSAPILPVSGMPELEFDPDLIQVSIGLPTIADWVISQVKGDQFFEIENFSAQRDQAYSAVEMLRQHRFTHRIQIAKDFAYYRKA